MQIVLIAVISLDGRLTRPGQEGPGFASPEDQAWFRRSLQEFDCSILGRETFDAAAGQTPPEAGRLRVVLTRQPERHTAAAMPQAMEFTSDPPEAIVDDLRRRGHRRCALLGGGQIYRLFLAADLVDALWLTLEPVLLGGGTPLVDGPTDEKRFALAATRPLSADTLLLNYRRLDGPVIPLPS